MRLLAFPNNQDIAWIVIGWAVLYGTLRSLLTDGSSQSIRTFDDSLWPYLIFIGWPALYWVISHSVAPD